MYVRRILVRNDLDRVVNGRGRDRTQLRCFLAHQVTSIEESSGKFSEISRLLPAFIHFENITDIDFGVITQEEDLAMVNNILTEKKGVKGIYFDIEWKDDSPHNGVAVDPKLVKTKLTKENRERLTRFYARYGVWEYLTPAEMFSMFPNITQLVFKIDTESTASTWRSSDAEKIAAFLEFTKNTKINELMLWRFNFSDEILKLIDRPLTHIKKVDIFTESWSPMDLSEVARVFPEAQTVTVNNGHVSLSREKLDALQGQKVKVGWQKVFLDSCKPASGTTGNLVFNHPVFAYPNLKVFKNDCSERLSIEQAPTLDDIKNQLIHRLIRENRDQSKEAPCLPVNFKKSK